jgi:hypothetical protein
MAAGTDLGLCAQNVGKGDEAATIYGPIVNGAPIVVPPRALTIGTLVTGTPCWPLQHY